MIDAKNLEAQINSARQAIASDGYPMSIGELTNLYRDGELVIRPEFQRFFRWTSTQKSRLIESLLLGIPLPSVFVAQTDTGVWEVVDGLQRISTILEFQGELLDAQGVKKPALTLEGTKYLPALDGVSWRSQDDDKSLSEAQRLDVKRAKLDLKIIKRESSPQTKFDIFQRLNSYGTQLNPQEIRSALLVAASPEFFAKLQQLAEYPPFVDCIVLSDKQIEERYDLELVTRFLVLHNWPQDKLNQASLRDLPQILDTASVEMATNFKGDLGVLGGVFRNTFDTIAKFGGEDLFKRWDYIRQEFRGGFVTSAFEVIAFGVGYRHANVLACREDLINAAKSIWSNQLRPGYSTGRSTESRLAELIPLGRIITGPVA